MKEKPLRFRTIGLVGPAAALCLLLTWVKAPPVWGKGSAFTGVVNLNTATSEELERLPGVGPSKAAKIIEHRQRRPFRTVAELVRVKGFGTKTLQRLRPFLTVSEPTNLAGPSTSAACVCPPTSGQATPPSPQPASAMASP